MVDSRLRGNDTGKQQGYLKGVLLWVLSLGFLVRGWMRGLLSG